MLVYSAVTLITLLSSVSCGPFMRNGEYNVPNDTAQCVNDLIDWCQGVKYPKQGNGISMMAFAILEPSGMVRYYCASDSDGTNCTKNGSPWISCSSDNKLSYNGKPIKKDSSDGYDENICKSANVAFNNLNIQSLVVDNTTFNQAFQNGMEIMFRHLSMVKEQMDGMTRYINSLLGFENGSDDPMSPGDTSSSQGKNQIEREQEK